MLSHLQENTNCNLYRVNIYLHATESTKIITKILKLAIFNLFISNMYQKRFLTDFKLSYTFIPERTIIFSLRQKWSFASPQEDSRVWLNSSECKVGIIFTLTQLY